LAVTGESEPEQRPWLIHLDRCASTSTWALDHAEALAHGAVVFTRDQTAGRGRGGKRWLAPEGVLTATVVLRQEGALPTLALAAGLAVCHAIEDRMPGLDLGLKWPNDVLLSGRKLAGVLCERRRGVVAVGLGCNLDPRWGEDPDGLRFAISQQPASLAEHGPVPADLDLLDGLRRYLLEAAGLLAAAGWEPLAEAWRRRDVLRGREVSIDAGGQQHHGLASGIDGEGRLLLRDGDGLTAVSSGHVARW
jgi:BirA family biotin operon repressor/biotin-[acetyl-CoA-carboxylase] ligase